MLPPATIGNSHPDRVVETNTLSSVPPPDITYTLSIPEPIINSSLLSALQLEAIIYACQVCTVFISQALILYKRSVSELFTYGLLLLFNVFHSCPEQPYYVKNKKHKRFCDLDCNE